MNATIHDLQEAPRQVQQTALDAVSTYCAGCGAKTLEYRAETHHGLDFCPDCAPGDDCHRCGDTLPVARMTICERHSTFTCAHCARYNAPTCRYCSATYDTPECPSCGVKIGEDDDSRTDDDGQTWCLSCAKDDLSVHPWAWSVWRFDMAHES